ncbi:NADH:ubiquinone oxidoreductase 10 kDa subunit [Dunaliella salina]|uniref:NADH:ubiquinone oxidoreductase 10 kDa subunit n=1 Tax=Dunaliella salina TaxID=3046 RepID=A0ABQ7GFP1_DUNSA|nr:NADH:ubiquinone oxidoreductase 10 kDa subunit [Dunaliella salina]|eukprot:KAF5833428.1 NADH:ubiquinone oxidoreductase 10 kDa subunit [Dunaliella salina]
MAPWYDTAGLTAGFAWAVLVNYQLARPWYRKPWMHAGGMVAGYYAFKLAGAYEAQALKTTIERFERKGYEIPADRRELFVPSQTAPAKATL